MSQLESLRFTQVLLHGEQTSSSREGIRLLQGKQHLSIAKSLQALKCIQISLPSSMRPGWNTPSSDLE